MLQSSLHKEEGMGTINQSVLYASAVISNFCLPKLFINLIGHKWSMTLSLPGYILWMAANGYAVWGTMVTASILVGISTATLWPSKSSYLTLLAQYYAGISGEKEEAVVARFFGIFYAICRVCKFGFLCLYVMEVCWNIGNECCQYSNFSLFFFHHFIKITR